MWTSVSKKLFIHGWATDGEVWGDVVSALGADKDNAIIPNLPGHGAAGRWLEPSLNPAAASLLEVLSAEKGPLTGIGWSIGAEVLLTMAASSPERFSSLILIGATPCFTARSDFPYGQSKALVRRMIMDMKQNPEATLKRFYPLNFTEAELGTEATASFMERYTPPGPIICQSGSDNKPSAQACRRAFNYRDITTALEALNNTDIRGVLGRIKTPTLIIHGKLDNVVPLGAAEFMADKIENATLEVFPSAGHAPFITEPERFVTVVKGFLANLRAGK